MGLARIRQIPPPVPPSTRWDVYRDSTGAPVTITDEQMYAVFHALKTVDDVRRAEGCQTILDSIRQSGTFTEVYKSRLLGRMLIHGRPPLDEKPPHAWGACDYSAVDPDWRGVCRTCQV